MTAELPDEAYAVGLAMSPKIGPAALRGLFEEYTPREAWERSAAGRIFGDIARPTAYASSGNSSVTP